MGVGIILNGMRGLVPNPMKMEDPLLQELLQIANSEVPGELGSSDLQHLPQPLSQWKNPVSSCIPAVPSECVRTAEESYLDRPYLTNWEDELLLQASQAFSRKQEEEEDSLLLAGIKLKKAQPLTNDEDVLWQKGALGEHTPQCLLDTLIFYIGMNFALRSGDEHRRLRFHPCQVEAKKDEKG